MEWLQYLSADDYYTGRYMLQKAIAFIYLISFINALNQFRPLCGEKGLSPVKTFLNRVSFTNYPSIFHFYYSDRFFGVVVWCGILLSALNLIGISDHASIPVYMILWLLPWLLYQSIVNTGQIFWGYGWESMLLEVGFLIIFLGPSHTEPPLIVIWLICWMLFRVEFGAGLIKMRGDRCWRKLTCLNYHHETQPLPNILSRYFHLLPELLHKIETGFNHFVQLIVVWGLFLPQPVASVCAILIIISQLYLIVSGNYSWLNWMTLSLGFAGISDSVFSILISVSVTTSPASLPFALNIAVLILGLMVIYMSIHPVKNMLSAHQKMNYSFNPLHLVNTYGAFGSVTKTRYEIVIEGKINRGNKSAVEWMEYEFKGKPGDTKQIPPQVSPYHYRLDWQMWFAALRPHRHPVWMKNLLKKLLTNDHNILKLIKNNPFPENGPESIRAKLYRYRFATFKERKETGNWWIRNYEGIYFPEIER